MRTEREELVEKVARAKAIEECATIAENVAWVIEDNFRKAGSYRFRVPRGAFAAHGDLVAAQMFRDHARYLRSQALAVSPLAPEEPKP